MANNYAQTSFMIPCTEAQAKMACWWISLLEDGDTTKRESIRHIVESEDTDAEFEHLWERAIHILRDVAYEGNNDWIDGFWHAGFYCDAEVDGIWVRNEESFNSDGCDLFIATVLDLFNIDDIVCYSVAETCSKPRLDEFGGYAVAVTRDGVQDQMSTWSWLREQRARFEEGRHKL